MEIVFLLILIATMMLALGGGFPVAFALPGSAIFTIGLAALSGFVFEGNVAAYFAHGDPLQWLNAGVTNFRGIYWEPERDTLIAIPLFIFMGIMLERSKIAEDLLVTMAQLFGPIPGGLGISVVLVGALLAATTGIVGATVIAMGLISLPVMLRNNYSHALATGTISASGTLGQIIPPSIVLIILADQLSNATDQASAIRTAEFKAGTGQLSLPSEFDITSTSAGDMFLGAFLPGMVLVGLYVLYILVLALLKPKMAPAAPFEGKYDGKFLIRVLVVLMPPLTLIFAVLGSIVLGIATVNQAGAIGAIGAMVMAGYRLVEGKKGAFTPAILAVAAVVVLAVVINLFEVNVKNIRNSTDAMAVAIAAIASVVFMGSVVWSGWRTYKIDNTLQGVMVETAKTTSLVFIILIGAAMLTASFRAFGGEELVRDFLTGLPGGFITKFIVVMAVIFVLGFFLDFIEIAVVVVPIIAPILLADPSANVTAVWFGVMIGVNMQTSFLTPPFGFALFYLRGVAPAIVRTISMYKGVVPFILLQLTGLVIVGLFPPLVNYLPAKVYLTSETAPPPANPRLQLCLEEYLFPEYDKHAAQIKAGIEAAKKLDYSFLPPAYMTKVKDGFAAADRTFANLAAVRTADKAVEAYVPKYRPLHTEVRDIRVEMGVEERKIKELEKDARDRARFKPGDTEGLREIRESIETHKAELARLKSSFPAGWNDVRKTYVKLADAEKSARRIYRRDTDEAYEPVHELRRVVAATSALAGIEGAMTALGKAVAEAEPKDGVAAVQAVEAQLTPVAGSVTIKSALSRVRRALDSDTPDRAKAAEELAKATSIFTEDLAWRRKAEGSLAAGLAAYDEAIRSTIGARSQSRLSKPQADAVASCQSHHRDISLDF
jgi:TRAP-type mannitol/chloroaromatic compound transport system permease large subunit